MSIRRTVLSWLFAVVAWTSCTPQSVAQPTGIQSPSDGTDTDLKRPAWAAPDLDQAIAVIDGHTGDALTLEAMLDRLASADVVFLGETHTDETTHRVELAVYEGLLERRREVVLAMEMFERDVQPALDAYIAGQIAEREFTERSRPWGQYRSAYRPLVERAREGGHPVIASNIPRSLIQRIAREGLGVLDTLGADERGHAPAELLANTPAYWRRVDNAIRGHAGMMRGSGDDQRLSSTQTLWDNTMGESCALALDERPGALVLHINGGFHSAYWDGTVRQFSLRKPNAKVLTVDIRPARNPAVADLRGVAVADFVVMAESRATDRYEGMWEVALDRKLRYRLHVPDRATGASPVPLLIWLGDDGLTAQDGLDLWIDRIGQEAAIAVLELPYRMIWGDLSEGGRWFWPDSFAGDIGSTVAAAERVWGYVMRHHPVDVGRVCVGGEGTGATVACAIALLGDRMDARVLAFEPNQYAMLKDFPLPLPEYGDDDGRSVSVMVSGSHEDGIWWSNELHEYREIGLEASFVEFDSSTNSRDTHQERQIRAALGLAAPAAPTESMRGSVVVPVDTPRARHWARLHALGLAAETGQIIALRDAGSNTTGTIELAELISPESIGDSLPRCPGPFGGTTVIVLPADLSATEVDAWMALEENDPLNKESRFHRLRVVRAGTATDDHSLSEMLTALEDQGRKNVLIVPALFCAGPNFMRALEVQTREHANRMTIQWLPGLGGQGVVR